MLNVPFTANARALGSYKRDTVQDHQHKITFTNGSTGGYSYVPYSANVNPTDAYTGNVATFGVAGAETAPKSVALHPRIHA